MSIAVSTVVMPSRYFAILIGSFGLCLAGSAALLAFGTAIALPPVVRMALALVVAVMAAWAGYAAICSGKSLRIDISEHGQITLAEDTACTLEERQTGLEAAGFEQDAGSVVRLLPDSTIWPHMLLLRLQAEEGGTRNVLILRDCMSAENFRALSVACRWIAAHNG